MKTHPTQFMTSQVSSDPRYSKNLKFRIWSGDTSAFNNILRRSDTTHSYLALDRDLEFITDALGRDALPFLMRHYNDTLISSRDGISYTIRSEIMVYLKSLYPNYHVLENSLTVIPFLGNDGQKLSKLIEMQTTILEWARSESNGKAEPRYKFNKERPYFLCITSDKLCK